MAGKAVELETARREGEGEEDPLVACIGRFGMRSPGGRKRLLCPLGSSREREEDEETELLDASLAGRTEVAELAARENLGLTKEFRSLCLLVVKEQST